MKIVSKVRKDNVTNKKLLSRINCWKWIPIPLYILTGTVLLCFAGTLHIVCVQPDHKVFYGNKDNNYLYLIIIFSSSSSDNRNNKNQCKPNFRYLLLPFQVDIIIGIYCFLCPVKFFANKTDSISAKCFYMSHFFMNVPQGIFQLGEWEWELEWSLVY